MNSTIIKLLKLVAWLLFLAFVIHSCSSKHPQLHDIPKKYFPKIYYLKFGDNWYKYYTGAEVPPPDQFTRYPINLIDYVKGEKLPNVINRPYEKSNLELPSQRAIKAYYTSLTSNYVPWVTVAKLRLTPPEGYNSYPKKSYCTSISNWSPHASGFEVGYAVREVHNRKNQKDYCLRSINPMFFDQHIYVRGYYRVVNGHQQFSIQSLVSAPNFKTGEYVSSKYPYILAEGNSGWPGKNKYFKSIQDVRSQVMFIEALTKATYVGPELPKKLRSN